MVQWEPTILGKLPPLGKEGSPLLWSCTTGEFTCRELPVGTLPPRWMGLPRNEANTSGAERWRGAGLSQSELVSLSGLGSIYLLVPRQHLAGRRGGGSRMLAEVHHSWFPATATTLVKMQVIRRCFSHLTPHFCLPDLSLSFHKVDTPVRCSHSGWAACQFPLITCPYLLPTLLKTAVF